MADYNFLYQKINRKSEIENRKSLNPPASNFYYQTPASGGILNLLVFILSLCRPVTAEQPMGSQCIGSPVDEKSAWRILARRESTSCFEYTSQAD